MNVTPIPQCVPHGITQAICTAHRTVPKKLFCGCFLRRICLMSGYFPGLYVSR